MATRATVIRTMRDERLDLVLSLLAIDSPD